MDTEQLYESPNHYATLLIADVAYSAGSRYSSRHRYQSCHDSNTETVLNLRSFSSDLTDPDIFRTWVKICDKITSGEMPSSGAQPSSVNVSAKSITAL